MKAIPTNTGGRRTRRRVAAGAPDRAGEARADSSDGGVRRLFRQRPLIQSARAVFWLMFLINALNYLDRLVVVAVGPTLKLQFHLTDRAFGLLSSAFLLVYTLAALPLGALADWRFPRARIVAVGVAFWSLLSGASAAAFSFTTLFVTRALVGVGEASYYPAGTALLSAYYPLEQRARVLGRWQAGQLLGVALAFGVSAILFALLPGNLAWRLAFLVSGAPGLALAALMWFVAERPAASDTSARSATDGAHPRRKTLGVADRRQSGNATSRATGRVTNRATSTPLSPTEFAGAPTDAPIPIEPGVRGALTRLRAVTRIRTVWLTIMLQAVTYIVVTPAIAFLPIYLRAQHGPFHLGASSEALVAGLVIVGGGAGGAISGGVVADWLDRRFAGGRIAAVGLSFALAAPFLLVLLVTHSLPVFIVTGVCAVFALNLQSGPLTAALQDVTPARLRGSAVALTNLLAHLCGDVWASTAVGALATALHEREGIALLLVSLPTLLIGACVALPAARIYTRDLRLNGSEGRNSERS